MHVILEDILQFPSFEQAQLIVGKNKLKEQITNAMVMEALDIKEWGLPGQILLTSYFAFKDSTPEETALFFSQAKEIGIAGFIFKTDRLVNEIPAPFISHCQKHNFPLIQIPGNISYHQIINDILGAISSKSLYLLKAYYENHQKFVQLMMKQADLLQILNTLENLIHLPVTLTETIGRKNISTNQKYENFKKRREYPPVKDTNSNISYKKITVNYANTDQLTTMLSVPIPTLGYENYELLIHEINDPLSDLQLMTIENTVVALQTELVKRYALRQNNLSHINEVTSKLISGHITDKEEIKETIHNLKLSTSENYRMIIFNFNYLDEKLAFSNWNRFIDKLIYLAKDNFRDLAFVQQSRKISFIIPVANFTLEMIKDKLSDVVSRLTNEAVYKDIDIKITVSNEVSVFNLAEGYKQAVDTHLVIDLWENKDTIVAYEEIGIFQLFIETANIDSIEQFIPEEIWSLRSENSELLETLYTFINVNQRYSEAAKILYVHPKTVRYRVNQLEKQYNIDFKDPEKILFYNVAIRIIKYLEHNEDKTV